MFISRRPVKKAILIVMGVCLWIGVLLMAVGVYNTRREGIARWSHVTSPGTGYQFPALSEIARMTIGFIDRDSAGNTKTVPEFDVPEQCWDDIIKGLSPSQYDPHPAKWVVLGSMEIELKNGERRWVGLYDLSTNPYRSDAEVIGAFSAGPDFKSRKYYLGGHTKTLKAAMKRAYAEYQKAH
jgi:hypothetical protein